jgi:large subunit ribosomal protein L10
MPTAEKTAAIEQLEGMFENAASIFLADFTGLNAEELTSLRRKCRKSGVQFKVIKNTLAVKATRKLQLSSLEPHFEGPTAVAATNGDPTSPARVLMDFQKGHEKLRVKLGFVDGRLLTPQEVKALATLPTRDQLLSQVMQLAQSPAQNFVGVLNAILTRLVRTVDAVREGMEKAQGPSAGAREEAATAEAAGASSTTGN